MSETTQSSSEQPDELHRLVGFGRRHPALTIAGLAGAGLIGGLELAVGIVLGAGIAAVVRRRDTPHAPASEGRFDKLRERARAVLLAARGKRFPEDAPAA